MDESNESTLDRIENAKEAMMMNDEERASHRSMFLDFGETTESSSRIFVAAALQYNLLAKKKG